MMEISAFYTPPLKKVLGIMLHPPKKICVRVSVRLSVCLSVCLSVRQRFVSGLYLEHSLTDFLQRGGLTLYEIYIGFCPRSDFYNIMHIAWLVHGHFISDIDFLLTT